MAANLVLLYFSGSAKSTLKSILIPSLQNNYGEYYLSPSKIWVSHITYRECVHLSLCWGRVQGISVGLSLELYGVPCVCVCVCVCFWEGVSEWKGLEGFYVCRGSSVCVCLCVISAHLSFCLCVLNIASLTMFHYKFPPYHKTQKWFSCLSTLRLHKRENETSQLLSQSYSTMSKKTKVLVGTH